MLEGLVDCDPANVAFILDHLFIISKINISLFTQILFLNVMTISAYSSVLILILYLCLTKKSVPAYPFPSPYAIHAALFQVYPTPTPHAYLCLVFLNHVYEVWTFEFFTEVIILRYRYCVLFWNIRRKCIINIWIICLNKCCRFWLQYLPICCGVNLFNPLECCWILTLIVALIFLLFGFTQNWNIFKTPFLVALTEMPFYPLRNNLDLPDIYVIYPP